MKTTKRLLALNLVLVLLLTLVPAAALADVVMELDEYVPFTKDNESDDAVFTFTPDKDGEYRIDIECPNMRASGENIVIFAHKDGDTSVERQLNSDYIAQTKSEWNDETGYRVYYSISFPYELKAGVEYKLSFCRNPYGDYKAKVVCLGTADIAVVVDEENFPDAVFRRYVLDKLDFNGDGKLSKNEIANITKIDVGINAGYGSIESLEGIKYFTSLEKLICYANRLTVLPELPESLTYLGCEDNKLTALPENLPKSLEYLYCSNNLLTELPDLPSTLRSLYCWGNQLTELPDLPASLRSLDCYNNKLTSLPSNLSQVTLCEINCSGNQLTELPEFLASLQYLNCYNNKLTSLPSNVSELGNLTCIECSNNQLTALPDLPSTLQSLYCRGNHLKELPELPASLTSLDCSYNQLTELSELPTSLNTLVCAGNKLENLDIISSLENLGTLDISSNKFTALPDLPTTIRSLNYSSNPLTALPTDLSGLEKLYDLSCASIGLEELPTLPESLEYLVCSGNELTNVEEISSLSELHRLDCSDNEIAELPALPASLTWLYCYSNKLTSIDLNSEAYYYRIDVSGNSLPDYGAVTGKDIEWDDWRYVFGVQNHEHEYYYVADMEQPSTCISFGFKYKQCSKCDAYEYEEIEPIAHDFGDDNKCRTCERYTCEIGKESHNFNEARKCSICGNYKCMIKYTDVLHIFNEEGVCTVCGNNIPDPYTGYDESVWTLTKDGVLTISGAENYESYLNARIYFDRFLQNVQKIVCAEGTEYFAGFSAFRNVKEINFGKDVKTVQYPSSLFNLETITVDEKSPYLCVVDGVLYNETQTELLIYPLYLGGSLSSSVTVKDGVESIGIRAFFNHYALKSVVLPDGLKNIKEEAFEYCGALEKVYIPSTITSIGSMSFYDCNSLTDVYFAGTEEQWNEITIGEDNENLTGAKIHYGHQHEYVAVEAVDATCSEVGYEAGTKCACGLVGEGCKEVAKLDHVYRDEAAVEPTCTEVGYTAGVVCKNCGYICSGCEEISATGHSYGDDHYCTVCDAEDPDYVEPVRPSHSHSYATAVTAPTCTEKGYTTYTCSCGSSFVGNYVDAKGHTEVTDAAVAATCAKTGLTEGKHCSECNEVLVKQEVIPVSAHEFKDGVCTACGAKDPSVNPFNDVAETSPYAEAVSWAYANNITVGKTDDTFGVNDGCTRGQIVTLLWRAAGSPAAAADTVNPFSDVSADSNYYDAIMWAVANGITYGTTATTFSPDTVCTRGQIVTFMYRAAGSPKVDTGVGFTDVDESSYCYDAVAWAVANGITVGKTDTTFAPSETCTRGQAVTFMYRANAEK